MVPNERRNRRPKRVLSDLRRFLTKAGKSTLSITAPAPRLYMDVESASRFLPINAIKWDPTKEKPPVHDGTWDTAVVTTQNWDTVQKAYQWMASGQHPFRSFIIDSISELQQRVLEEIAGREQLKLQDWGNVFRRVTGLLRDLRDLTAHPTKPLECIVLTAMAKQVEGTWTPFMQGQTQTVLPYLMDCTAYLFTEMETDMDGVVTEQRKLLTRRTAQFEAGQRVGGAIEPVEVNPNLSEIINRVFPPAIGEDDGKEMT